MVVEHGEDAGEQRIVEGDHAPDQHHRGVREQPLAPYSHSAGIPRSSYPRTGANCCGYYGAQNTVASERLGRNVAGALGELAE